MKRLAFLLALALWAPTAVFAQGAIQQSGPVTTFHAPAWYSNGYLMDGGTPATPYLNSLGLFGGANCPFGVSSQTSSGLSSSPYSMFTICQTASTTTLNFAGVNGQAAPNVVFNIGGTPYPLLTAPIGIAQGGTGQVTAPLAINALLPSQAGSNGYVLGTNGTVAAWTPAVAGGSVTSVGVSGGTTGLTTSGGPITTSGTITLSGTLGIPNGGTGATFASAGFNALSPITSTGDLIVGNGANSATRLGIGSNGQVLQSNGTTASWQSVAGTGSVTSVGVSGGSTGLTTSGGPITGAGTITLAGTLAVANGGTGSTTQNFVDITTNQPTIAGIKNFTGQLIGKGTATNDNAAAGYIGEYISATVLSGSAVSLTGSTPTNVTSISLTAGDYDLEAVTAISMTAISSGVAETTWISTTSATSPTIPNSGAFNQQYPNTVTGTLVMPTGRIRMSLATTTTVYLEAETFASAGVVGAYGFLSARRVR